MRSDKTYIHNSKFITDRNNKPVSISFNVEHNAIVRQYACRWVEPFYISRPFPKCQGSLPVLCLQRLFCVSMPLPEITQYFFRYDSHISNIVNSHIGNNPSLLSLLHDVPSFTGLIAEFTSSCSTKQPPRPMLSGFAVTPV